MATRVCLKWHLLGHAVGRLMGGLLSPQASNQHEKASALAWRGLSRVDLTLTRSDNLGAMSQ